MSCRASLSPPGAGEALLVAVVDDRLTAGQEHQRVRQLVPRQQLLTGRAGLLEEGADPAHVVVAEERRQLVRVRVGVGVVVVVRVEVAQLRARIALGERDRVLLEAEVERRLQRALRGVRRHELRVGVEHLAEHEEVLRPRALAAASIAGENFCQNSMLTCLTVSIRNPSMPNSAQVL